MDLNETFPNLWVDEDCLSAGTINDGLCEAKYGNCSCSFGSLLPAASEVGHRKQESF